jgi:hypothetical protein
LTKIISEKLAPSPNPANKNLSDNWLIFMDAELNTGRDHHFVRTMSSRFSHLAKNCARTFIFWNELEAFSKVACPSILLHLNSNDQITIKEELLSMSLIWYYGLLPLWVYLAKTKVVDSVILLQEFNSICDHIIDSGSLLQIMNPEFNVILRENFKDPNSPLAHCSENVIRQKIGDAVRRELSFDFPENFLDIVRSMALASKTYLVKVMGPWLTHDIDEIPAGVKDVSMTNAITERYFSFLDTITKKSPGSTISSRASISTARYNHVFGYLSELDAIDRDDLIRKAFSNNDTLIKNRRTTESSQKKVISDKIKAKSIEVNIFMPGLIPLNISFFQLSDTMTVIYEEALFLSENLEFFPLEATNDALTAAILKRRASVGPGYQNSLFINAVNEVIWRACKDQLAPNDNRLRICCVNSPGSITLAKARLNSISLLQNFIVRFKN